MKATLAGLQLPKEPHGPPRVLLRLSLVQVKPSVAELVEVVSRSLWILTGQLLSFAGKEIR